MPKTAKTNPREENTEITSIALGKRPLDIPMLNRLGTVLQGSARVISENEESKADSYHLAVTQAGLDKFIGHPESNDHRELMQRSLMETHVVLNEDEPSGDLTEETHNEENIMEEERLIDPTLHEKASAIVSPLNDKEIDVILRDYKIKLANTDPPSVSMFDLMDVITLFSQLCKRKVDFDCTNSELIFATTRNNEISEDNIDRLSVAYDERVTRDDELRYFFGEPGDQPPNAKLIKESWDRAVKSKSKISVENRELNKETLSNKLITLSLYNGKQKMETIDVPRDLGQNYSSKTVSKMEGNLIDYLISEEKTELVYLHVVKGNKADLVGPRHDRYCLKLYKGSKKLKISMPLTKPPLVIPSKKLDLDENLKLAFKRSKILTKFIGGQYIVLKKSKW